MAWIYKARCDTVPMDAEAHIAVDEDAALCGADLGRWTVYEKWEHSMPGRRHCQKCKQVLAEKLKKHAPPVHERETKYRDFWQLPADERRSIFGV